jgi:hypothetical protein
MKVELPSRDNSNFLSPNYHIIITMILKFGQKILKMILKHIFVHNVATKNYIVLVKKVYT